VLLFDLVQHIDDDDDDDDDAPSLCLSLSKQFTFTTVSNQLKVSGEVNASILLLQLSFGLPGSSSGLLFVCCDDVMLWLLVVRKYTLH